MPNLIKKIVLLCIVFAGAQLSAQNYTATWGDDTKMRKSTVDMDLIHADNSGVYFLEGEMRVKSYFVIGATLKTAYKLVKFDKNFTKLYEKDYGKDLKDVSFNSMQPLKNMLYVFASHYDKRENYFHLYGSAIDGSTGELTGQLKELGSWYLQSDKDDVDFIVKPTPDSTRWMVITSVKAHDNATNLLDVTVFDDKLNKKLGCNIKIKDDPATYSLEDIVPTVDGKFLILAKQFEMVPTKRKKQIPVFKKYLLAKYNTKGVKEADFDFDTQGTFTIGGKIISLPNGQILLAGFYSNASDKKLLNGIYINKIDVASGKMVQSSMKEISKDMISNIPDEPLEDDDDDDKVKNKKSKKDDDEDDPVFNNSYKIRSVDYSPATNDIWITAESYQFKHTYYTTFDYDPVTHMSRSRSVSTYTFTNSDLMVISSSTDGQIHNVYNIPKKQVEQIRTSSSSPGMGISFSYDYGGMFASGGSYPYYSSVVTAMNNNKLIIFFNDKTDNANVKDFTSIKQVKAINNSFKNTALYAVSLDLANGAIARKQVITNDDKIICMPRFAFVAGNNVFLPASHIKALARTDMRMGKIAIQ